jgi:spermidine/putrescine transport system permease protein
VSPQPATRTSQQIVPAALTNGPGLLWLIIFLMVPLLFIAVISFASRGAYGELELPLTFQNYKRFFGFGTFGFDPLYPIILLRSLMLGLATTLLCVLASLPLAFYIAGLPQRYKTLALTLVVIPLWTNLLIRTYAWQILLAPESWLTKAAAMLGFVSATAGLYPGTFAVSVGMVCDYLPFLVLPLYASVEKIDWDLADAARDLGADSKRVFLHAILPQITPGLIAGLLLVFIPATGQFVIPDLLGGAKTVMLGNAIQQQFGPSRDWPFGSAITVFSMAMMMVALWVYGRTTAKRGELM